MGYFADIARYRHAYAIAASAAMAVSLPRALPSGTVTCGSNKYSVSAITAAINGGVKDMDSGYLPGQSC